MTQSKKEYSAAGIYRIIQQWDKVCIYRIPEAEDLKKYTLTDINTYMRVRAPWESPLIIRLDIENAIQKLNMRDKFILLAGVYEADGSKFFCKWIDLKHSEIKMEAWKVLQKLVKILNPDIELRGGTRPHAGRPRKSKRK